MATFFRLAVIWFTLAVSDDVVLGGCEGVADPTVDLHSLAQWHLPPHRLHSS